MVRHKNVFCFKFFKALLLNLCVDEEVRASGPAVEGEMIPKQKKIGKQVKLATSYHQLK